MAKISSHWFSHDPEQSLLSSDDQVGHGEQHEDTHDVRVTFDQIDATAYLYADNHADGTFVEKLIWRVDGLENGGTHIDLPGLGSRFGMYFIADATGHTTGGLPVFDTLKVSMVVDPGNNDGVLSSTANGLDFANGTRGDHILAQGDLVSAALSRDADGTRHANFVEQFTVTQAGQDAFGASLRNGDMLRELLTTPVSTLTVIPNQNDSGNTTLVNAGGALIQLASGGPMTLALDNMGRHRGGC
jgi:hypothetical protein